MTAQIAARLSCQHGRILRVDDDELLLSSRGVDDVRDGVRFHLESSRRLSQVDLERGRVGQG